MLLYPSRTGGGNAIKMAVGRRNCLHKMLAISEGLSTFYVGNPACLPKFLKVFLLPVCEGLRTIHGTILISYCVCL